MLGSFPPKRVRWSMEFSTPIFKTTCVADHEICSFFSATRPISPADPKHFDRERIWLLPDGRVGAPDTASEVVRLRDNASDNFLQVVRPTDVCGLLDRLPECRAVVTTGEMATGNIGGATQVPASCCRRFRTVRIRRPPDAPLPYAVVVARLSPVRGMEGGVLPEDVRCGRYDLTFCLRFRLGCSVRIK